MAKALAAPEEITVNGKVYQLSPLNFDIQMAFSTWLKRRTLDEIQQAKSQLPDDEYMACLDKHFRDRGAGAYDFIGTLAAHSFTKTFAGKQYLMYLRLRANDNTIDEETAGEIFTTHMEELERLAASMDSDPNSEAPAVQTGNPGASKNSAPSLLTTPSA